MNNKRCEIHKCLFALLHKLEDMSDDEVDFVLRSISPAVAILYPSQYQDGYYQHQELDDFIANEYIELDHKPKNEGPFNKDGLFAKSVGDNEFWARTFGDNDSGIDEFVVVNDGISVHMECMGDKSYWIGVEVGGDVVHFNLYSNSTIYANCEYAEKR